MLLPILRHPDPRLRIAASPVVAFDAALRALVADMAETMHSASGVGLAAPQIGRALRMFVVDIAGPHQPSELRCFANPEIIAREGMRRGIEGCLSLPGVFVPVDRSERVTVRAQDERGDVFTLTADGLLAVAIQHEADHLDGLLMVDR